MKMSPKLDRIGHHIKSAHISLSSYVRTRQVDLYEFVKSRQAVYLDTKFWIILRNVELNRSDSDEEAELLLTLRKGVVDGALVCPICESTFSELMKQTDEVTRCATAKLIDELSLGVALIDYFTRANTELACLLHGDLPVTSRFLSEQLVWTRVAYVLGELHPSNTGFDAQTELALQKAFVDVMWDAQLSDIVESLDFSNKPNNDFDSLSISLNQKNALHSSELKSFQHTYEIESYGAVDLLLPVAEQIIQKRFADKFEVTYQVTDAERDFASREIRQFLVAILNGERSKEILRTMHISTALHAYLRWNKGQQWHSNHFYDLHHAAAAIGYCDLFLTERGLKGWLTSGPLKLDNVYGCQIACSPHEALQFLKSKVSDT